MFNRKCHKIKFMKKILLQYWQIKDKNFQFPDGCSMHLSFVDHLKYIKSSYRDQLDSTLELLEVTLSEPIMIEVGDSLYNKIKKNKGSLRLSEVSLNNLINLRDIKFVNEDELVN